jgi:two-component system, response regulator RegA
LPELRFRSVLVVDDDEHLRTSLVRSLVRKRAAYAAAGSDEALDLAREHEPELCVVDLQLGAESGVDLVRGLRALLPSTRILVMTGFGSIESTVAVMRAGADDVIAKPFTPSELLRRAGGGPAAIDFDTPTAERAVWEHVQRVLAACGGNKSLAARRLDLHRSTLRRILSRGCPEK